MADYSFTTTSSSSDYATVAASPSISPSISAPWPSFRAVEVKDGWVGQIVLGDAIVWQSSPHVASGDTRRRRTRDEALTLVKDRLDHKLGKLFGGD